MSSRIKTAFAKDEALPENYAKDVAWINENRLALYEQYGSCVLLVYHQEIIGHGASLEEAVSDAEAHINEEISIITPVIKYLSKPYRIGVLRQKKG
jgi:hypothetical protein